ncbi:DUF2948 family protein [uncultured Ferrovibrio sp.]|jgi:hypothetical protein|uniref:DUF2948 family protein n=1 Tax=uncultured Ferrovibrio sp. TaxID=1576913 RepID=UPI0026238C72|nr:DUF2948 family protein [uncultured Ferrovibrio sp.]
MAAARYQPLRLRAEDVEDITVLSACLQDATLRPVDMTYQPRQRRFALVLNRFRWEDEGRADAKRRLIRATPHIRVAAGLHFDGVLKVQSTGIDRQDSKTVLELLSILAEPREDPAAQLTLVFAGGGAVKLDVECIDAQMQDIGTPFPVRRVPQHKVEE